MDEIVKYSGCFVCGDKNPDGLRLKFYTQDESAVAECVAEPRFQGFKGIYHGGLVATLLDEIMAKAVLAHKRYAMTVEINIRFRKAVMVGEKLRLVGWVTRDRGRVLETSGEVRGPGGELYATGTGKYMEASSDMRRKLLASLE